MIKILRSLEFKIVSQKQNQELMVEVPTFRVDVSIPEDLIEEIGRIYGYENIEAAFPIAVLVPPKRNEDLFWENSIKEILKGDHFNETYNYSFNSAYQIANFQFSLKKLQEVENPVSIEQKYLRPSLIPNLLKNVEKNLDYFPKIRMFELGKIFYKRSEKKMLTGLIAQKETNAELFYQSKGTVDLLLNRLGISNVWYDEYQPTPEESKISIWHTQKCAEIKTDGQEIGFLGEISPSLLKALKIKAKVAVFDLDFQALKKVALEECEYRPISRFPASVRDLAVLVPKNTKIIEVLNEINTAGGKLIRDIDIFDIYEGEGITDNKKNVAFRLIYQSDNKTLTAQEVDEIQNKIMETLGKIPEWEVRK